MDALIWLMVVLAVGSFATAFLGLMTFLLTVWGLWSGRERPGQTVYMWDHSRASVLAEKPTYITNGGRFAPVQLTPEETGRLRKMAGSHVKVVYIVEEPLYQNATKHNTHVYP